MSRLGMRPEVLSELQAGRQASHPQSDPLRLALSLWRDPVLSNDRDSVVKHPATPHY